MFLGFFKYLKFVLNSTNQHGVHSPFVFNYITKCLYKKPEKSNDKTLNVLLKSIPYFGFESIILIGNSDFDKKVKQQFPNLTTDANKVDLLYLESTNNLKQVFSKYKLHNDSLIIIDNINASFKNKVDWSEFIESKNITVSMNLYHCGVLSIRKEQCKEHFLIRI